MKLYRETIARNKYISKGEKSTIAFHRVCRIVDAGDILESTQLHRRESQRTPFLFEFFYSQREYMRRLNISREKSYCWGRFSFYFILPKPRSTHSTWIETTGEMQRREEEEEEEEEEKEEGKKK